MITTAAKAPVRNGLKDIRLEEFWNDPLLIADTLELKLTGLPVTQHKHPQFAEDLHDVLRLVRATGLRQYGSISLLCLLDLLEAVDYFLVLHDQQRDSQDDGYEDDAAKLRAAIQKHRQEMDAFRLWFNRHG